MILWDDGHFLVWPGPWKTCEAGQKNVQKKDWKRTTTTIFSIFLWFVCDFLWDLNGIFCASSYQSSTWLNPRAVDVSVQYDRAGFRVFIIYGFITRLWFHHNMTLQSKCFNVHLHVLILPVQFYWLSLWCQDAGLHLSWRICGWQMEVTHVSEFLLYEVSDSSNHQICCALACCSLHTPSNVFVIDWGQRPHFFNHFQTIPWLIPYQCFIHQKMSSVQNPFMTGWLRTGFPFWIIITPNTLYIVYCTLYIIYYTLYIIYYVLYIIHYTLYIIHYTLYIIYFISYIIYYILYTIYYVLYII